MSKRRSATVDMGTRDKALDKTPSGKHRTSVGRQSRQPAKARARKPRRAGENFYVEIFTAHDLQNMSFPPVRYAVEPYVPEGLTLFAGKPKIGKSWMALDFAMAIAKGDLALGSIPCERGNVLYCALEDNQRRLQRRMRKLYGRNSTWPERFHFTTQMPRLNEGGLEWLESWIVDHDPALIIIDTLVKVRRLGAREGDYEADYAALSPLQELAGELGVAIIVIHHLRKMGGDDPLDMISGTTGLTGAVDTALVLHRDGNGVSFYGRGREIEEFEMAVEFNHGAWRLLGEAAEVHRSKERAALLDILTAAAEPMGPKDIAEALGAEVNNIKQLLFKMAHTGEVQKEGRGKYRASQN